MRTKKCPPSKPKPPCAKGYIEKEKNYKDGSQSKCCYKFSKKKRCPISTPQPPCKLGFKEKEKIYKDGTKLICCYKDLIKKKNRLCPPNKPNPPCNNGLIEKEKKYKDGTSSKCCYKNKKKPHDNSKKNKIVKIKKKIKKPSEWPEYLSWPLPENVSYSEIETYPVQFEIKTENFNYLYIKQDKRTKNESKQPELDMMEFDEQFEIRNYKQLEKLMTKTPEGVIVTEKMDGHRMYWDGKEGWSRSGKTKFNLPPFWRDILEKSPEPLDGELFLPGFPASQVSTLRGKSFLGYQLWHDVAEYHLFDLPKSKLIYKDRIKRLKEIGKMLKENIDPEFRNFVKVIPSKLMKSAQEIEKYFQEIMIKRKKSKYVIDNDKKLLVPDLEGKSEHVSEGLILGLIDKKYQYGPSYYKIKYKEKYEKDCVVIEPHPSKASLKVYRNDCEPYQAIFYLSTEGRPKNIFQKGDIIKYTCLGFTKGNDKCPSLPKMPKFKEKRTENTKKINNKSKPLPIPKNGPNEEFAKYYENIGKVYFDKKMIKKGIAYKKHANILRRHPEKINSQDCFNLIGMGSLGKQCICILEEYDINKDWMKKCADGRL